MTKQPNPEQQDLDQSKSLTALEAAKIMDGAVDAVMANIEQTERAMEAVKSEHDNQLAALDAALKDYPGPITEEVWDKEFSARVSERLAQAKKGDQQRYTSQNSRDVMANTIKVASMGITLARVDSRLKPSSSTGNNIKKYANEVRRLLQKEINPDTGKPWLRSIARPERQKKLPAGQSYMLIGCETADLGLYGANTVLATSSTLADLRDVALRTPGNFKTFLYVLAPEPEVLEVKLEAALARTNSAVFSGTVSQVKA